MTKQAWDTPREADEIEPDNLDTLMTLILVVALVCFCAFALGMFWQIAQPLIGAMK